MSVAGLEFQIGIDKAPDERVAKIASINPFMVDYQGQIMSAINGMPNHCHVIGDPVRVTRSDQFLVVTSTMARLPGTAVVLSYTTNAPNVTVASGNKQFDAQLIGSYVPVAGDRVAILWTADGPYCPGRRGVIASPPDLPVPPDDMNVQTGNDIPIPVPPPASSITTTILAKQTGDYNYDTGALYTGDQARYWLYSGYRVAVTGPIIDSFWFYGDGLNALAGVTVTKAEIYLQRATGVGPSGATDFYFYLHTAKTKPSTYPNLTFESPDVTSTSLTPGQAKWLTLPLSWGQSFASTASLSAWGIGIATYLEEPYKALYGIDHTDPTKKNASSGALRVTYKRPT